MNDGSLLDSEGRADRSHTSLSITIARLIIRLMIADIAPGTRGHQFRNMVLLSIEISVENSPSTSALLSQPFFSAQAHRSS